MSTGADIRKPTYVTGADIARVLGIRPSAVSNRLTRGSLLLPEPAAHVGKRPLWTVEQLRAIVDGKHAEAIAYLETLERETS